MAKGDGAFKFEVDSYYLLVDGSLVLYSLLAVSATICIVYLLCKRELGNYTLSILLTGIFMYSVL